MNLELEVNINAVISLAQEAGEKILNIYSHNFEVLHKVDKSPLTEADLLSQKHRFIC